MMAYVFPYLLLYVTFIDSQGKYKIGNERMAPIWLKSCAIFYLRLLLLHLKVTWIPFFGALAFVSIGIMVNVLHPSFLIILTIMYTFNCFLQYSKPYNYSKYVIYLVPLIFFMLEQYHLVYIFTILICCLNISFLFHFKLRLYERPLLSLPKMNLGDKKVAICFISIVIFVSILVLIVHYHIPIPLEDLLSLVVIILITIMQIDISNNKLIATKVRSRFNLVRSKSQHVSFNFLIPKQREQIVVMLVCALFATSILGIIRHDFLTYFLLFCGIMLFFLYTIDYIIQCVLLNRSIIYENKVVKAYVLDLTLIWIIGMYYILFVVGKYVTSIEDIPLHNSIDTYYQVLDLFQVGYTIFCATLITFFIYRLYKNFLINKQKSLKDEKYSITHDV